MIASVVATGYSPLTEVHSLEKNNILVFREISFKSSQLIQENAINQGTLAIFKRDELDRVFMRKFII